MVASIVDIEKELDIHRERLESLIDLDEVMNELTDRDRSFASDLCHQYIDKGSLSAKQWDWVKNLRDRVRALEPIYGNFDAILVMFRIAGDSIKYPKVRLLTKNETFVQLNFDQESKEIKVYIDGWQGHGFRKFCGWVKDGQIMPYRTDRMNDDVKTLIHEFSLDPARVAKASANLLGCCSFCGKRLSDEESKHRGYGKTCAGHYDLPWGKN